VSPPPNNKCLSFAQLMRVAVPYNPAVVQPPPIDLTPDGNAYSNPMKVKMLCPQFTSSQIGLAFCGKLLNGMLTIAAAADIEGGFFVQANVPQKVVEIGMKGAGLRMQFEALLTTPKAAAMAKAEKTYTFTLTNGKNVCMDPANPSACLPALLAKEMFSAAGVPVVVLITAQLMAEVTFTASVDGELEAHLKYDETIGFDTLSVGWNGFPFKTVTPTWKHNTPTVHRFIFNAKGTLSATIKVYPKIDVVANGVPFTIQPWVSLTASASVALSGGVGRRLLGSTGQNGDPNSPNSICLKGQIDLSLGGGVTVGIDTPTIADVVGTLCGAVMKHQCDTGGAKLADCLNYALTDVKPCQAISNTCGKIQKAITTNTATGAKTFLFTLPYPTGFPKKTWAFQKSLGKC